MLAYIGRLSRFYGARGVIIQCNGSPTRVSWSIYCCHVCGGFATDRCAVQQIPLRAERCRSWVLLRTDLAGTCRGMRRGRARNLFSCPFSYCKLVHTSDGTLRCRCRSAGQRQVSRSHMLVQHTVYLYSRTGNTNKQHQRRATKRRNRVAPPITAPATTFWKSQLLLAFVRCNSPTNP